MQRRDINKRLSFAEAENGQKDRNKEEVEEERELATEKGINKSGVERGEGERGRKEKERERERGEPAAPAAGPRPLKSLVALLDQRPDLLLSRYTIHPFALESFYFRRVQGLAGVSASRYPRSHFFRIVERNLEACSSRMGWTVRRVNNNDLPR